ncbi:MAG TPA: peptidylprolyl isomerase [Dehalococcoidia bacterium]|nr:peptidylprolyl isomerase [Dehalococcoidia bacterium]
MSDERRRQQRRERQRRRTTSRPPLQQAPAGPMPLPGVFGWVQRNGRLFALLGVIVLLISLGGRFLTSNRSNNSSSATTTPTPKASATPTASPTATPTFGPTGTPSADGVYRTYTSAPPMQINENGKYEALIRTEKGDIRIELLPQSAPEYVNNFVFLARNHFYDGLTFHRVVAGFAAQAGDPLGNNQGGPGYTLDPELNSIPFDEGIISMAGGQQGVSGSQFFITMSPQPALKDNGFSAFGRVIEGIDVVKSLTVRDPGKPAQPPGDRILSVQITER